MSTVITFLQNGWASIVGFFGPMSVGGTINLVLTGAIIVVVLFQIVRHSQLRYYLMVMAVGVSLVVGDIVYLAMAGFVLPRFSLDPSQTAAISSAVGTLVGLCTAILLFWLILKPKTGNRIHRRSKKSMDNIATVTGSFGNTQAGSFNPDWGSDRALQANVVNTYRPGGRKPTDEEVIYEIMRRREERDRPRKH